MLKNMLILRNPLKLVGHENSETIEPGSFAAILARAGVGKTALLVQIAINAMLKGTNVLHISTEDPVDKVGLWYQEVFQRLTQEYDAAQVEKLRDQLLRHRFIMTFETESFSVAKLQKRVDELISQEIFCPGQIVIEGFSFADVTDDQLSELKSFAENHGLIFWFSVRTHREEPLDENGIPHSFTRLSHQFDPIIRLHPDKDRIYLKQITKNGEINQDNHALFLDPSTMLINELPA